MRQRLAAADLAIDADALALLAERVEGNLLAAVQEVEKLKLLATDGRVITSYSIHYTKLYDSPSSAP